MLLQQVQLRMHVLNSDNEEIAQLLLSPAYEQAVDKLIKKLEKFEEVT